MSLNKAVQRGLDDFFTKIQSSDYTIREVTKGAFSQARGKLNEQGFIRLNEVAINTFYNKAEYYVWHDHRVLSADGTRFLLPNHRSVKEEFGVCGFGPKADSTRSMAIGSMLYDVLNQITLDAQLGAYKKANGKSSSERALLTKHMPKMDANDLLLLDRYYPSIALFFELMARGVHFCMRMKTGWWKEVREFKESDATEKIVSFKLPKKDRGKLKQYPDWLDKQIQCRLIKIVLDTGEEQILCTSLMDRQKYLYDHFKELYHLRWNEEEAYKLLKNRVELEDFTGKTANAVKQDFHAKILLLSLAAIFLHAVEERVKKEFKADQNRKHSQKINKTNALAQVRNFLIPFFVRKTCHQTIKAFDAMIYKTREIIRPDRKNPRKHRQKRSYSMNYKRL